MTPDIQLTARQREIAERLVTGWMPDRNESASGRTIDQIQASLGVLTVRAACFRLLTLGLVPAPAPAGALDLDPVTRTAWEALRFDLLDVDLIPTVATGLSHSDDPRASAHAVDSALNQVAQRFTTTRHGLIRLGLAHHVLFADQNVKPPAHQFAAPTPPGTGTWDATPAQRRVLALRASGRDVAACAAADGTTIDAVTGRLNAAKRMAGGVRTPRALIHRALCDGVLQRPAPQRETDPSPQKQAVWRHFVLDEPEPALASRTATHTGLSMNIVDRWTRSLRTRYRDDCAVVYEGWRYGVLDAGTPTDQTCCAVTGLTTAHTGGVR
ncbi:hypothetical protein [Streptomyces sp. MMBL 11-1]|uniref:hypothetical protein n=1 Tax=Streptomyces sp. MMBL 11-1 TaxID=3026420 RepID=UPI0023606C44|nr:hypothetical protein [Streptomyces sp. MMBL 11-1]